MTCCFLGHREIYAARELRTQLYQVIEDLIVHEKVDTFLFGSKSGTKIAFEYAVKRKKKIYCFPLLPSVPQAAIEDFYELPFGHELTSS